MYRHWLMVTYLTAKYYIAISYQAIITPIVKSIEIYLQICLRKKKPIHNMGFLEGYELVLFAS